MNLLQLHIRPAALMRFAATQGLARGEDEDLGYACHAWLQAMFGALAPKPFRLFEVQAPHPARLLGYSSESAEALTEHARTFADPLANAAWDSDTFAGRTMPTDWQPGRQVGFEVLACPMSRKDDKEKDVFLRHVDAVPDGTHDRAQVYCEWLAKQLAPAATVVASRLDGFRRVKMLRRSAAAGGGRRLVALERPQALFQGELHIEDPTAFAALLARGIGRHRAFGYGMLLLRPAG
jgi:CRISPR system Cascade subunit CasE